MKKVSFQTISKKNNDKKLYIFADIKKEIKNKKDFNNFKSKMLKMQVVNFDHETQKNIYKSARNIKKLKIMM